MWRSHKNLWLFCIQLILFAFFWFCVKLKDPCDSCTLAYSETAIPQSKAQLLRWNASLDINNCSQPFHLHWSCARRVPPVPCEQGVVTIIFSLWLVWPWVICFVLGEISRLSPSPSVWIWVKTGGALRLIQFELIAEAGLGSRVTFRHSEPQLTGRVASLFISLLSQLVCGVCDITLWITQLLQPVLSSCITLTLWVRSYFCYSPFSPAFVLAAKMSLLSFFCSLFYSMDENFVCCLGHAFCEVNQKQNYRELLYDSENCPFLEVGREWIHTQHTIPWFPQDHRHKMTTHALHNPLYWSLSVCWEWM